MRFLLAACLALPLSLLTACSDLGLGEQACSTIAVFSVSVTVTDMGGNPVPDAKVTFSVDGGAAQNAECLATTDDGGCTKWAAGTELTGTFTIDAASADGTKTAQETVEVDLDESGCHVDQKSVTLVLP